MEPLAEQILAYAHQRPADIPLAAKALLHLGTRAGVDKALARLAMRGALIRVGRGVYFRPHTSRFGTSAPPVEQAVRSLALQRGEIIVSTGAEAANSLGLSTQVPVQSIFLTSGRTRTLHFGKQAVELRHAPRWQLSLAARPAGEVMRAIAWIGPAEAEGALRRIKSKLPPGTMNELLAATPGFPSWLAHAVLQAAHG